MAVTIGGTPSLGAGNPPAAIAHTTPAGTTLLVVQVGTWVGPDAEPYAAMTFNGVALTLHPTYAWGSGPSRASFWYLLNPPIGAFTVVITAGASSAAVVVSSWIGTDTASPLGTIGVTQSAPSSTPTTAPITGAVGNMLIAHVANLNETLVDVGGQTSLGHPGSGGFQSSAAYKAGSGSSTTFGWTGYTSDTRFSALAVELKVPAVAGGSGVHQLSCAGAGR